MAVISSKLYKALLDAKVTEKKALEAAEEVVHFESDISSLKQYVKILISLNIAMFCTMIATLFAVILLFAK